MIACWLSLAHTEYLAFRSSAWKTTNSLTWILWKLHACWKVISPLKSCILATIHLAMQHVPVSPGCYP